MRLNCDQNLLNTTLSSILRWYKELVWPWKWCWVWSYESWKSLTRDHTRWRHHWCVALLSVVCGGLKGVIYCLAEMRANTVLEALIERSAENHYIGLILPFLYFLAVLMNSFVDSFSLLKRRLEPSMVFRSIEAWLFRYW